MRCRACDCLLTDFEATRKEPDGYLDLCDGCLDPVSVPEYVDHPDKLDIWDAVDEDNV